MKQAKEAVESGKGKYLALRNVKHLFDYNVIPYSYYTSVLGLIFLGRLTGVIGSEAAEQAVAKAKLIYEGKLKSIK